MKSKRGKKNNAQGLLMFISFWGVTLGLVGMESAVNGHGGFIASAVVLSVGIGCSILNLVKGSEWE